MELALRTAYVSPRYALYSSTSALSVRRPAAQAAKRHTSRIYFSSVAALFSSSVKNRRNRLISPRSIVLVVILIPPWFSPAFSMFAAHINTQDPLSENTESGSLPLNPFSFLQNLRQLFERDKRISELLEHMDDLFDVSPVRSDARLQIVLIVCF